MKINSFGGDVADVSATMEPLVAFPGQELQFIHLSAGQWSFSNRNIGFVTPKIVYFH